MLTPSQNLHGFVVDDDISTILFGKGFDPKQYQELFDVWINDFSQLTKFTMEETKLGEMLQSRLRRCSSRQSCEGYLSGVVSAMLQKLMATLNNSNGDLTNLEVVHQTYVDGKTSSSADISVIDCFSDVDTVTIHSIMELNWDNTDSHFPEAQACAYAARFNSAGSFKQSWLPTFVLSKTHYQIGVSFKSVQRHWGFSEIEVYSNDGPFSVHDVTPLLRFAKFFCYAAQYHRSFSGAVDGAVLSFVDKTGSKAFQYTGWIGARVLVDRSANKIVKFYSSRKKAQSALENQKLLEGVLGNAGDPELVEGCGDGMSAIIDDLFAEANITYKHLISLTIQVDLLSMRDIVHGDLRAQNILFLKDGVVRLIDFDWSGAVGVAEFPNNVNAAAFGPRALHRSVTGGGKIPRNFDWHCLADIFDQVSLSAAADSALTYDKDAVIRDLKTALQASKGTENFKSILKPFESPVLNLGFAGGRLHHFYKKRLTKSNIVSTKKRSWSESESL